MNVRFGKAWDDSGFWDSGENAGQKSGWFVGPHASLPDGIRKTEYFEVKWYQHSEGEESTSKPTSGAVTLSVLVSGTFSVRFRAEDGSEWQEYVLREPGDYVIWGPGLEHDWKALKDSIVLTVRPATGKIFSQDA